MENNNDIEKREINEKAANVFMSLMVNKSTQFVKHFDTQTNILIGVNTAVVALVVTMLKDNGDNDYVFIVLGLFSVLSLIVALYAIHPPKFMRKRGQKESMMYNKEVSKFPDANSYSEEILKLLEDREEVVRQYTTEIYNLYKYYYRPKRRLFKISRNLLLLGIVVSSLIYIIF